MKTAVRRWGGPLPHTLQPPVRIASGRLDGGPETAATASQPLDLSATASGASTTSVIKRTCLDLPLGKNMND